MSFPKDVISILAEKPLSVPEIASKTALSTNYVRTQLRLMEAGGMLERVDMRTPIIYKVSENNPTVKERENIDKIKKGLLKPVTEDEPALGEFVKKYPKNLWPQIADAMRIMSIAMKELNEEGKLIDTL